MEYLNEKYDDQRTDDLLDMASLVDPRFKTQYIKPDKIEAIKMRVVSEILEGDQGPSTSQASYTTEVVEAEGGAAAALPAKKQQSKSLGSFFKKPCPSNTGLTDMQSVSGSWRTTSWLQMQTVKQNPWIGGRCMRDTFQE